MYIKKYIVTLKSLIYIALRVVILPAKIVYHATFVVTVPRPPAKGFGKPIRFFVTAIKRIKS